MSGGVDSSVAAWLLREQGHDVIGLFMRHGQDQPPSPPAPLPKPACPACGKQGCCTAADAADARRVADMLGIPFYAVNFQQEFARIVDYFVAQYTAGRTPNPCIVCNTWLKFGKLFEYADQLGAEFVATGHYARLVPLPDGQIALCRGRDEAKDQSYVLFGIPRRLLPRLMFPVGEHRKEEIREMAERLGLPRGGETRQPGNLLRSRPGPRPLRPPAPRRDRHLGRDRDHRRRRWWAVTTGSSGLPSASARACDWPSEQPRYVVRIEPDSHRVVIGTHDELARNELTAAEANWLVDEEGVAGGGGGWWEMRGKRVRQLNCRTNVPMRPAPCRPPPATRHPPPFPFGPR